MKRKTSRRDFLKNASTVAVALAVPSPWIEAAPTFDVVLRGGTILDGTGGPAYPADLGIRGDTIAAIGSISADQGKQAVDISGFQLCPGFVDIHTHSDGNILAYPNSESRVYQGVTTELTGNCGGSAAPVSGANAEQALDKWRKEEGISAKWNDVASYFTALEQTRISINQGLLLGQGTIRENAIGLVDRTVTPDELKQILRATEEGMDQGAFGLSTGLEYTPGTYTPTDEIVEMTRIVSRYGGLYASHTRNEVDRVLEAVHEAIDIGRRAGVRVEVSHLKVCGKNNWHMQHASIELIESARRDGIAVYADVYPYTAYSTGLDLFLQPWAREGGSAEMVKRLRDSKVRAQIRKEAENYIRNLEPGDYDLIVISSIPSEKNRPLVGKNVAEIASIWKMEPVDALLRLLEEEEGNVSYIGHAMSPENVEMVMAHPLVMIGSDGYTMAPTGKAEQTRPHPRSYGAYPRVLAKYWRERKIFDLPTAIRKMTSMPADQMGITDRGRIAKGKKADLVVFDSNTVKDEATFENPHRYPDGIQYVLVNGAFVIEQGKHNGARPGKVLRKT